MALKEFVGRISENRTVVEGVCRLVIELDRKLDYIPGQYVIISTADDPDIQRSYSIMEASGKRIVLGLRNQGGFSARLCSASPGMELKVKGPYGRFTLPESKAPVLIAGGIGVTPLYSMARWLEDSGRKATLYYSAPKLGSAPFLDELLELKNVAVRVYLTRDHGESTASMRFGKRLSVDELRKDLPDFESSVFLICGPGGMIEKMSDELAARGIPEEAIRSEEFIKNG